MFLTKGPLPHGALWAAWLSQAGGLLPADCAAAAACGAVGAAAAGSARRAALEGMLHSCAQGTYPDTNPRTCVCCSACHIAG